MKEREKQTQKTNFLFVGENRSPLAIKNGYTWDSVPEVSAHHSTKLFRALTNIGLTRDQQFVNAWNDDGSVNEFDTNGKIVIAMGQKVQEELKRRGIPFIPIVHPAARGIWCKQEEYNKMISESLVPIIRNG
jgi:beta-xylosidase